jgi:hypothetical protein
MGAVSRSIIGLNALRSWLLRWRLFICLLMIFVQQQAVLSPAVAKVVYAVKVTGGDNPITVRRVRSTVWVVSEFSSIVRGLWTVLRSLR